MRANKPKKRHTAHSTAWGWLRWIFWGWVVGGVLLVIATVAMVKWLGRDLPNLGDLSNLRLSQVTYIYSDDNVLLGTAMSIYRKWVGLDKIPRPLQWATIVSEDRKFYTHPGVDPKGIVRAVWACLKARRYVQGGSTITMQLARNLYLSPEKTINRKLKELLLSVQLERRFSKEELLELYLNIVCYGHGAYGVQAAAELYFGKDVSQLNLGQCALLAALPKRPSDLSPFVNPKAAKQRRDYILDIMLEEGYISKAEAETAKKLPVTEGLRPSPTWATASQKSFHFLEFSKRELVRRFGQDVVDKGGLKVYTSLNYQLQKEVERIAERYLRSYQQLKVNQMAIVVIHIPTGKILAMYGGRPYRLDPKTGKRVLDHFNRATQAFRQPGSSFKPYVYAAALEMGFKPASVFNDSPISFPMGNGKRWAPKNYDGRYGRDMSLKTALALSNNVIAVKLIRAVGVDKTVEVTKRMGIRFAHDPYRASYALALGAIGVTVLDHTTALTSVATGGIRVEPTAISRVYDSKGNIVYAAKPETQQVLAPEVAQQLLTMLISVVTAGTGRRAQIPGYQVAGKTGTSEQVRDVWFVGFTPTIACGIWIGDENFKPLKAGSGGTLCAPVFSDVVTAALKRYPGERTFAILNHYQDQDKEREDQSKRMVQVTLCAETGLLATEYCPVTYPEMVSANQSPKRQCPLHKEPRQPVLVCTVSGKLATPNCPPQNIATQTLSRSEIPTESCDVHISIPTPDEIEQMNEQSEVP